jgi:hypothetical protein
VQLASAVPFFILAADCANAGIDATDRTQATAIAKNLKFFIQISLIALESEEQMAAAPRAGLYAIFLVHTGKQAIAPKRVSQ